MFEEHYAPGKTRCAYPAGYAQAVVVDRLQFFDEDLLVGSDQASPQELVRLIREAEGRFGVFHTVTLDFLATKKPARIALAPKSRGVAGLLNIE